MNVVALICARGGSKGLPGKNVRPLGGKPLITWSIEHARAVARVSRVIVSTDSEEIAHVARLAGAEVPFMRPAELAQDTSAEWLVWRHALTFLKDQTGAYPDALLVPSVTAPLRLPGDLDRALDEFAQGKADVVISVTDAHRSPYFNQVKLTADGLVELVIPPATRIVRRQDVPVVYDVTTVGYVAAPQFVMDHDRIFDGRVRQVHVPPERAVDIDTLMDFRVAEALMAARQAEEESQKEDPQ